MSANIYVGAYIVPQKGNATFEYETYGCVNKNCSRQGNAMERIYPRCGGCGDNLQVSKKTRTQKGKLRWYAVQDFLPDNLKSKFDENSLVEVDLDNGKQVWTTQSPNVSFFRGEAIGDTMFNIKIKKKEAIASFLTEYQPLLDYIRDTYGVELKVKFGTLVRYY